jgi:hypothetical protein
MNNFRRKTVYPRVSLVPACSRVLFAPTETISWLRANNPSGEAAPQPSPGWSEAQPWVGGVWPVNPQGVTEGEPLNPP